MMRVIQTSLHHHLQHPNMDFLLCLKVGNINFMFIFHLQLTERLTMGAVVFIQRWADTDDTGYFILC